MIRFLCAAGLGCCVFFGNTCAETITFGVVGDQSEASLAAMWSPLFETMQQRTGIVAKPLYGKDYQSIIEGMNRGTIQVASFGNRSAIDVIDKGQGEIFAQWVDDKGRKGYLGYLIALKSKHWKSFDDILRNSRKIHFAFGDPKSTSGTLVPQYYLFAQKKIKAEKTFASVTHGNHELNVEAVLDGKVDVATTNSQVLDKLSVKEPEKFKRLQILWTSPLIPQDPLIWRKDLSGETKKKLRNFLLSFGKTPEEHQLMIEHMGFSGFAQSDDNQLLPIRQLELYRQRQEIELATDLPPTDKFRHLLEIDAQLAEIGAKIRQFGPRK